MADLTKLFYRISETAMIVGVEPHVLRYWESEFPQVQPKRSRTRQRVYSRRDVEKLLRIRELLYVEGLTIAGAKKRLRWQASAACVRCGCRIVDVPEWRLCACADVLAGFAEYLKRESREASNG